MPRSPASSLRRALRLLAVLGSGLLAAPFTPSVALAASVDLNTADAATLARDLLGVGETRARAIVEHRRRNGPFRSVDELALVRGIGAKTVERNRARVRVSGGAPPAAAAGPPRPEAARAGATRVLRRSPPPGSAPDDTPPEIIVGD
jgi:competence protein ComEA